MANSSTDSVSHHHRRRGTCRLSCICAALLLSPSATSAFAPITPTAKPTLASRSAIIQRYRVEDDEISNASSQPKHQSDAYSFLPSRLSSIERLDEPSQFRKRVLEDKDSLVVVRFYSEVCPSCRATRPLFTKWRRDLDTSSVKGSQKERLPVKILEMPLNKATSAFLKDTLRVDQLPYCHLYHPRFGMVEEQLVVNRVEFQEFVNAVHSWSKGLISSSGGARPSTGGARCGFSM